jgi:hypothetical protein
VNFIGKPNKLSEIYVTSQNSGPVHATEDLYNDFQIEPPPLKIFSTPPCKHNIVSLRSKLKKKKKKRNGKLRTTKSNINHRMEGFDKH